MGNTIRSVHYVVTLCLFHFLKESLLRVIFTICSYWPFYSCLNCKLPWLSCSGRVAFCVDRYKWNPIWVWTFKLKINSGKWVGAWVHRHGLNVQLKFSFSAVGELGYLARLTRPIAALQRQVKPSTFPTGSQKREVKLRSQTVSFVVLRGTSLPRKV